MQKEKKRCRTMENKWQKESLYVFWAFGYLYKINPGGCKLAKYRICLCVEAKHDAFLLETYYSRTLVFKVLPAVWVDCFPGSSFSVTGQPWMHPHMEGKALLLWHQWKDLKRLLHITRNHNSPSYISCHFNQIALGLQVQKLDWAAGVPSPFIINIESKHRSITSVNR